MRLGIKAKQVIGVTTIVGAVVVVLSAVGLARLAQVRLDESRARAELLANAIYHRASAVVVEGSDPYQALHADAGMRSVLEASLYSNNVTFAAIVDPTGIAVMHVDVAQEGHQLPASADLAELLGHSSFYQLKSIYSGQGRNLDYSQPLLFGDREFGSIRIGVSTLLIRDELDKSMSPAIVAALTALGVSVLGAIVLAQILLRPIHVLNAGLTRLGRGELGVRLDLDQRDEFGELGTSFNTVSAQLSKDRTHMADQVASLESTIEHLEEAVAIVSPSGQLLFANPAMRGLVPGAIAGATLANLIAADHPLRSQADQTLASRQSRGPISVSFSVPGGEAGERLLVTHPVNDAAGNLVGVMLIVRNVEYLSHMYSTVRYSRKLAALGRLSAGVAHEVKNPLNSMMIHLELLRQRVAPQEAAGLRGSRALALAPAPVTEGAAEALQHVDVIAHEIRRLDEVVQGFLKFTRPEDLKLQPVALADLLAEVVPIVRPEAQKNRVELFVQCHASLTVNGDPTMLRQAFLNLALNAVQAMPDGGTLRIYCEAARGHRVAIRISDTGAGIKPEHLERIFHLYFTTKSKGSGIGLSMVFRTIQMHDGDIEVQSTVGKGTTFKILLPQA